MTVYSDFGDDRRDFHRIVLINARMRCQTRVPYYHTHEMSDNSCLAEDPDV